jgi:putative oxidoreductase
MMGHGLQKLNGSFGGPGLEGTEQAMGGLGLHPAKQQALAAALSETVGGALTAAGFLSPLGPAMIAGTMAVAIHKVHAKNGVWVTKGGYEYNLTLIAAAFALASEGPGPLSLDGLLRKQRSGFRWGVASLILAGVGAAATVAVANRFAPPTPVGEDSSAEDSAAEDSAPGDAGASDEPPVSTVAQ